MAQTVYPGKDVYLTIANEATPSTTTDLHGEGNGLGTVTWGDPAQIVEKLGTGPYREKYDTGQRRPTCVVNAQIGSVIEPALIGQHGVLKTFVFGKYGNTSGDPRATFDAFIVEPNVGYGAEEAPTGDFTLNISGTPVEDTWP